MKYQTKADFTVLSTEERYVELAARIRELGQARGELQAFKDEMTGNRDIPWDPEMDKTEPEDKEKYDQLVWKEDEKWCRVREMVRDALGDPELWQC